MTFREVLRAIEAGTGYGGISGISYRQGFGLRGQPPSVHHLTRGRGCLTPESWRTSLARIHSAGPRRGRGRNVTRLHLRLQLLFHYRDARAKCSPLFARSRPGRHRGRTIQGCPVHLLHRRQPHARRAALRSVVPGHRGQGLERRGLHRAGHDLSDRESRRHARSVDGAGRLSVRVSQH